jgi:hypothetical protein
MDWIYLAQGRVLCRFIVNKKRTFGFHKSMGISWLLASEEGSRCMKLFK